MGGGWSVRGERWVHLLDIDTLSRLLNNDRVLHRSRWVAHRTGKTSLTSCKAWFGVREGGEE